MTADGRGGAVGATSGAVVPCRAQRCSRFVTWPRRHPLRRFPSHSSENLSMLHRSSPFCGIALSLALAACDDDDIINQVNAEARASGEMGTPAPAPLKTL